jgi:putative transcriptional regulator
MKNLVGHLLIAEPRLQDPNFYRSVVLITQHGSEGASGVILNRPLNVRLSEIWPNLSQSPLGRDHDLFLGGPVQGPLAAVHSLPDEADSQILPDLYLSVERTRLNALFAKSELNCRVFSGYAGWGESQLENELEAGGWFVLPARTAVVFADPEAIYGRVCEEVGSGILFPGKPPASFPLDPTLN